MKNQKSLPAAKQAFTLIELLIVIAIIGIIAAVVVLGLSISAKEKARIAANLKFADSVRAQLSGSLVSWWKLDSSSDDSWEGNGGILFVTTAPGPQWVQGVDSDALSFNRDGYIAINNLYYDTLGQIKELTVCAWIQTTASGANNWAILDFDRSDYFNFYTENAGRLGFSTSGEATGIHDMYGNAPVNDGEWYHVCAAYDSNKTNDKTLYIDGKLDLEVDGHSTGEGLGTGVTRYGFIGDGSEADTFNGSRNNILFDGVIDEVQLYHEGMTLTQIQQIYAESAPRHEIVLK